MQAARGVAERLLALEQAVAELRALTPLERLAAQETDAASEPSAAERLAQVLGNARLAAVLVRAGYTSVEAVAAAPDDALLAIDGVGEKALKSVRDKVAGSN